ncbi:MAG: ketoacyl-ACP synthase III, partial [Acidobacteriota bacterium]|nr:ketoacyl-ACP synthase III [Acidobacteriota bacterium]
RARIVGTGMAVPERVVTNADLEKLVDTTDEWIVTRTGIRERRMAAPDEALTDFALPAADRALEMAGVAGTDVDLVICATVSPDRIFPATSCAVQDHIGALDAPAFDLSAACTGFIYGVALGAQFIEAGRARNVVVVGGEMLTKIVDWTDRATCVLFGDGAGAVVLQAAAEDDRGVMGYALHADGSLGDLIERPGGGSRAPISHEMIDAGQHHITMRGNETFKKAVRRLAEVSEEALAGCGLEPLDVDWFIPHQANRRIIDAVGQRLAVPEGSTYVNVDRYGNTSAASVPIALDELNRAGRIQPGQTVLMTAFGSGLTWASAVVKW